MAALLLWIAVLLGVFEAYSLFKSNEGIRGAGRVSGGLSKIAVASLLFFALPAVYAIPITVLVLIGLVTFGSGARKFMRRNG